MLIHAPCLGRQKQNIDSARSSNEKSMGVRNSSVLRQRQGTGGQGGRKRGISGEHSIALVTGNALVPPGVVPVPSRQDSNQTRRPCGVGSPQRLETELPTSPGRSQDQADKGRGRVELMKGRDVQTECGRRRVPLAGRTRDEDVNKLSPDADWLRKEKDDER
ncbi:unnamed protein product [Pleuronectes platessa]|uniref:Uncharacterized protein n=1 Tax=Pleuronectes platessa TaxID=8262 RepID=A0A9N7Z7T8_PLEPL|nr:unnamed protein product [Pleuronectes platessa]